MGGPFAGPPLQQAGGHDVCLLAAMANVVVSSTVHSALVAHCVRMARLRVIAASAQWTLHVQLHRPTAENG